MTRKVLRGAGVLYGGLTAVAGGRSLDARTALLLEAEVRLPMAEKSPRRKLLEERLAEDPRDAFLRYGLAVQCLREGDVEEGRARLRDLISEVADEVAACQQLGQSYLETGETSEAVAVFREGIARARAKGDAHAAAEMEGLLESNV